ncbi:MAG: hypothetical protein ACFBSG_20685 [Leptolyngbyaceae cyanobacterium]
MTLTEQYLDLINCQLPQAAQRGRYPVRFNHCFARIILDSLFQDAWYHHLDKPAYRHLTEAQLQRAIALGQKFLRDPQACFLANQASLSYRQRTHSER